MSPLPDPVDDSKRKADADSQRKAEALEVAKWSDVHAARALAFAAAEDDEALKRELEADGAANALDAEAIRARVRRNDAVVAAFDIALDTVLRLGGAALSAQVPGAGVVVEPARALAHELLDDSYERWKGSKPKAKA